METSSIKLFGKNIISVFKHYIMRLDYDKITPSEQKHLKMEYVTDDVKKMIRGTYDVKIADSIVRKNKGRCEVMIFQDASDNIVGTLSIMFNGGNDIEYRIKNIDAFIYNVYTVEEYRGNGYAGEMIKMLMNYLHSKGINEAYLAVSTNNRAAIRSYQKVGFETVKESSFFRIAKQNIPYRIL